MERHQENPVRHPENDPLPLESWQTVHALPSYYEPYWPEYESG